MAVAFTLPALAAVVEVDGARLDAGHTGDRNVFGPVATLNDDGAARDGIRTSSNVVLSVKITVSGLTEPRV